MGICGSKEEMVKPTPKQSEPVPVVQSTSLLSNSDSSRPASGSSTEKLQDHTVDGRKKSLPTLDENKELTSLNNANLKQIFKSSPPRQQAKVLLLGAGESGKSTILKQIKIIHQNGFTESEKMDYKPFVYQNIISSAQSIAKALQQYNLVDELEHVSESELSHILDYGIELDRELNSLEEETALIIKKIVEEPAVTKLLNDHISGFYLLDSANYFFSNLDRICNPDYIPNETDILRTRRQTSGIFDTKFQLDNLDIHLYDVGGQRSERKKWIHCFDNVTAIMFCVALSEYDQTLLESSVKNRLEESLNLFESVTNSMWFRRTSVILCLNKIDVFIEKLPRSPLENYFPDYVGGDDVSKAVKYILWRFKQLNRSNLNLVPYVTQATDTNNIRSAFAVVKETIVHNELVDSGVINPVSAN